MVAERAFDLEGGGKVVARLYQPVRVPRIEDKWACAYSIDGIRPRRRGKVYGVDGLQALLIGAETVRVEMESLGILFSFAGGEANDTGVPRSIPIAFGLAFSKRAALLVERASTRFVESLRSGKVQRPQFFDSFKRRRN